MLMRWPALPGARKTIWGGSLRSPGIVNSALMPPFVLPSVRHVPLLSKPQHSSQLPCRGLPPSSAWVFAASTSGVSPGRPGCGTWAKPSPSLMVVRLTPGYRLGGLYSLTYPTVQLCASAPGRGPDGSNMGLR